MLLRTFAPVIMAAALLASDGFTDGKDLANGVGAYYRGGFNDAIIKPMTSSAPMKTVDGSKTFANANVECTQTTAAPFFRVDYSVDGNSEIHLSTYIDKDLDGAADISGISWASFSGPISPRSISGVCFAGVVSCTNGTWDGCKFYEWRYSGSQLILAETAAGNVSSCECTNVSCGAIASSQGPQLLDRLATGAVTKIMASNSKYTISKVEKTTSSVVYWGQDYSNCNNNGISMDDYGDPTLEGKGYSAQADMSSTPNSAAYAVMNSSTSNESTPTQKLNYFGTNSFGSPTVDDATASAIGSRQESIANSSTAEKGTGNYSIAYTDTYVDKEGNVVSENKGAIIQTGDITAPKYCTVYWYQAAPDVFSDQTNRTAATSSDQVKQVQVRECAEGGSVCPLNSGEWIEKNCAEGSQKELAQMVSRMQGIQEAAEDMICSTK